MKNSLLGVAILLSILISSVSSPAQIAVDLTSESWSPLLPNTPNQTRQIHVSGGGNVWGMDFRIRLKVDSRMAQEKMAPIFPMWNRRWILRRGPSLRQER